ncbi:hypothetical protein KD050_00705 [Psychrobacillus sp. INOP01]|uniref:hypothetical protein n=1 Tax=Psychrobacillus sp. INOP01 TaxID=2829187 RepID=UPI001BAAF1F5|nr:hypothetical protein [Psychrobacillus sp. INOP01]QUG41858.1 hypothetical protein KD050_00705 [Psychrobacillus sp. INOP01]
MLVYCICEVKNKGNHQATDHFFVVMQQVETTYEELVAALHELKNALHPFEKTLSEK